MPDLLLDMAEWLHREDGFTLISHTSPDGDTIGSSLALYHILCAMGKRVQVICEHIVPYLYAFLPGADMVCKPEHMQSQHANVISVDCAAPDRMGSCFAVFEAAKETGNIDHHKTNGYFGNHVLHDERASATAELIYALYQALHISVSQAQQQNIAACLFVAISTDTGNFAYSNTTPQTFHISAALLEMGIDIAEINRRVYRAIPINKRRLQGHVLNSMQFYAQGRIGIAVVMRSDLERTGACVEDIEGLVDFVRDVDTVEIAILIRQKISEPGFKASLRSKKEVDVSAIAEHFQGGGHLRAAGCSFAGELQPFHDKLLELAKETLC